LQDGGTGESFRKSEMHITANRVCNQSASLPSSLPNSSFPLNRKKS
jgi:hypothetical protein